MPANRYSKKLSERIRYWSQHPECSLREMMEYALHIEGTLTKVQIAVELANAISDLEANIEHLKLDPVKSNDDKYLVPNQDIWRVKNGNHALHAKIITFTRNNFANIVVEDDDGDVYCTSSSDWATEQPDTFEALIDDMLDAGHDDYAKRLEALTKENDNDQY